MSEGLHLTFATDAASQQRTLISPDIWPCPMLRLVFVLLLKPGVRQGS